MSNSQVAASSKVILTHLFTRLFLAPLLPGGQASVKAAFIFFGTEYGNICTTFPESEIFSHFCDSLGTTEVDYGQIRIYVGSFCFSLQPHHKKSEHEYITFYNDIAIVVALGMQRIGNLGL